MLSKKSLIWLISFRGSKVGSDQLARKATSPTGRVTVSWALNSSEHATNLVFAWREFGGPPVAVEAKSRYGTRLIRGLVPHELGGTVDLEFAAEGVSCRIEFPLSSEPQGNDTPCR
jgi:two-component sensor histidine kinase